MHEEGWTQARIAEALGVTAGVVSQWFKRVHDEGLDALRSRREESGRRPGLTAEDLEHLKQRLELGPGTCGCREEVWTQSRVRDVIRREFDITHTPRCVGLLLKKIG